MLKADQLGAYFPDLSDRQWRPPLAIIHSRYSTNTLPQWGLAQPFRMLAHNGEINTLQGNVHWLKARQPQMHSETFGADLPPCCRWNSPD
jgi:glutamate synthase (NADPH/NADH) large chain/glutamate synthase (ferredoxin)